MFSILVFPDRIAWFEFCGVGESGALDVFIGLADFWVLADFGAIWHSRITCFLGFGLVFRVLPGIRVAFCCFWLFVHFRDFGCWGLGLKFAGVGVIQVYATLVLLRSGWVCLMWFWGFRIRSLRCCTR